MQIFLGQPKFKAYISSNTHFTIENPNAMQSSAPANPNQIKTREQLIYALSLAAELEHGLTCIYLFAAFSMKKFLDEDIDEIQRGKIRDWQSLIFSVAREEMEHLGLVCNMLNAIGGAQHFDRPNLPQPADYYSTQDAFTLERFSLKTMRDFMDFEKPANISTAEATIDGDQIVPSPFKFTDHHTVQELYNAILHGFKYLDADPDTDLFIGPPDAQIDDDDIDVGFNHKEFGITMIKITNLAEATNAIDEIVEQGEGILLDECLQDPDQLIVQGLYQKLTAHIEALNALKFSKADWATSIKKAIKESNEIVNILQEAGPYIPKEANDINYHQILEEAVVEIKTGQKALRQLKIYSPENARKANKIRETRISIPATYDGEGVLLSVFIISDCHYLRFWQIYQDFKKFMKNHKGFDPARNVVNNPMVREHADANFAHQIFLVKVEYTLKVMELFNGGYEVMVQMLLLFFAGNDLTDQEKETLMRTAFFPFMTMFVRPAGGVLTQLPAEEPKRGQPVLRAGPSFEYYINTSYLPHKSQAWQYLHERIIDLTEFSAGLQTVPVNLHQYLTKDQLKDVEFEMAQLHTNLNRIAANFAYGMGLTT